MSSTKRSTTNRTPVALPIPKVEGRLDVNFNVPTPPTEPAVVQVRVRCGDVEVSIACGQGFTCAQHLDTLFRTAESLLRAGTEREEAINRGRALDLEAKRLQNDELKAKALIARAAAREAGQ